MLAGALWLLGCSDNEPRLSYSYLRSASDFSVDTVRIDTLCDDPGPNFSGDGDPGATCRGIKKFKLTWERPVDTVDFLGYRLYLDTTPSIGGTDKSRDWLSAQKDDKEALIFITETAKQRDGLVFFFYDGNNPPPGIVPSPKPDTLKPGSRRLFGIDSNGREEADVGRFVFALATRYDGKSPGQPQPTILITDDNFPPNPFIPQIVPGSRELKLAWARPTDPTSFFNPGLDSGLIRRYVLTLKLSGKIDEARASAFKPTISYSAGGKDRSQEVVESVLEVNGFKSKRVFTLPDSGRGRRSQSTQADSLSVVIGNLKPQDTLDVSIHAVDSAGNSNDKSMNTEYTVRLTDTTRPSNADLRIIDSLTTENSFTVAWPASRDSVDANRDGKLEAGPAPNFRIAEYRISRVLKRPPGEPADPFDRIDTVIRVDDGNVRDTVFTLASPFLPPGKAYTLYSLAVDSTGFRSFLDSVEVSTRPIVFSGADSGSTCPPGFVPIPGSPFRLGEEQGGDPDEQGGKVVRLASYCIEPYEHRDPASGGFATRVTWEEADSICLAMSPQDSSMLCSEAQWERACEGFDAENPHSHGIQSQRDPSILQSSCNQGTGDLAMAMSFELRNPVCLTNEGVYDMAGNLSEWVRDPYNPRAYAEMKDSALAYGFAFPPGDAAEFRGVGSVRGGNYLKPNAPLSAIQALARCSNRDFPMQVRPQFKEECVSEGTPKLAAIYGPRASDMKCFDIPSESLKGKRIVEVRPATDSTKLLVFTEGERDGELVDIPPDTVFRGRKPIQGGLAARTLARVVFVHASGDTVADTLDAREMRDTSQAALARILERESPSASWSARKVDGRYEIKFLYAHTVGGSSVAKPYYASRNIGFRCCAKPRPAAPPDTSGGG
jgi:formylglycine-generating enzyme required for sulfatase activity